MQIHHYDPTSGLYLGASQADASPQEPDVFLIPAHATAATPPASGADEHAVWDGASWRVEAIPAPPAPPVLTLEDHRAAKRAEIEAAYQQAILVVTAGYPQEERDSWGKQETEARAVLQDPAAQTPLLTAIAGARGMTVTALAELVVNKAGPFAVIAGQAFGRRRARMATVDAAVTLEDLAAIIW